MRHLLLFAIGIFLSIYSYSQVTTVQTLTYDSTGRDYVFQFPPDDGTVYRKIIMEYSMRCKDGLVSTQGAPNDYGCGEWDYSVNTFIQDSSKTDSIKAIHPSHTITGFSGTEYNYTTQTTYSYKQYLQYNMVYNTIISESEASIGTGTESLTNPFKTTNKTSKTQYLWTATELTTAGLSAGDITGLKLNVISQGDDANFLRIKIKQTSQTELSEITPETNGFTEVYFKNTQLISGINQFNFYNNFAWDGTSNLLLEFSFTNSSTGVNTLVEGHNAYANMALLSNANDNCLEFSAIGDVDIHNSNYSTVVNEVSVVFWAYGNPDILPANTSAFEARDNQDRRQVHAHLPWSNSGIYWDCGNTGNYDRINKTASASEIGGRWNYWAFTKNATTGEMKIYLNGMLWHSGTGKTNPIDIESFKFGSNVAGNYPYFGKMDNFSVWDKELTQAEIQNWMYKDIDATHPEYSHLINYFAMNEGSGNIVSDSSPNNVNGEHSGVAVWKMYRGNEIFKSFTTSTYRPNITFIQGDYTTTVDTIITLDSTENNPNIVYSFDVVGGDLVSVDTNMYYQSGNMYVYDENNNIVDTVIVATENTINITDLQYYNKYPSIFEIMSFVSPYGLYLDLGMEGKTWQFDVTDFAPILKDSKRLYITGGVYQEDIDIRFIFTEGVPARNVVDIQQIWRAGTQRNYQDIMSDKYFEPRDVHLSANASTYKLRTAITGHGQEGEFIQRQHYINLNGGSKEFQWYVWKECAENPIYPQGGTWIYDRAGWCPGAATDMHEFEITNFVTPGGTVNIDYGITTASGDSRYIVNNQLVSYGAPNFTLDAEIVEIQRPSKRVEYSRENPVCYHPSIIIRNTGSTNLTSLKIMYGVSGGTQKVYNWTGYLPFDNKVMVQLPIQESSFWIGDGSNIFTATVSEPNGSQDEYADNNTQSTEFDLPDMYNEQVYIYLKNNFLAYQNEYTIKDVEGNIVFSKGNFDNNAVYMDTLDLPQGCYTFEITDSGNDGLEFWANSSQGTGYLRLKSAVDGSSLKIFETDFGKSLKYSFSIGDITYVQDFGKFSPLVDVYPNPTVGLVNVNYEFEKISDVNITITDLSGKFIVSKLLKNSNIANVVFDLSNENESIYLCKIQTNDKVVVKKIVLSR